VNNSQKAIVVDSRLFSVVVIATMKEMAVVAEMMVSITFRIGRISMRYLFNGQQSYQHRECH
jgi:hypothetical protein